jgi:hypothetical protein
MRGRLILSGVLIVIGLVWLGQGLGLIPGSGLMDGDVRWAIIGAVLVGIGVLLGVTVARRRPEA